MTDSRNEGFGISPQELNAGKDALNKLFKLLSDHDELIMREWSKWKVDGNSLKVSVWLPEKKEAEIFNIIKELKIHMSYGIQSSISSLKNENLNSMDLVLSDIEKIKELPDFCNSRHEELLYNYERKASKPTAPLTKLEFLKKYCKMVNEEEYNTLGKGMLFTKKIPDHIVELRNSMKDLNSPIELNEKRIDEIYKQVKTIIEDTRVKEKKDPQETTSSKKRHPFVEDLYRHALIQIKIIDSQEEAKNLLSSHTSKNL